MGGVDYGPTVIDGIIQYLSPSGITTADPSQDGGCYRKWWLKYIARIREPFTGYQKLGVQTHAEIEHFMITGELTLGNLAMSARHFIPEPDPAYISELQMQPTLSDSDNNFLGWPGPPVLAIEGIRTVGHIDLYRPCGYKHGVPGYSEYLDHAGEPTADPDFTIEVLDWKTSSDIGKWAKMGPDLIKTVQMPLYAKFATVRHTYAQHVRISHVYMQTKGVPRAHKSTALLSLKQIDTRWEQMRAVVRTLKDVAKATRPEDVPANLHACGSFRGCMHAGTINCPMNQDQSIDQMFGITKSDEIKGNKTMSLIDDINNLGADPLAATPAPTAEEEFAADWAIIEAEGKGTPPLFQDAAQVYAKMKGITIAAGAGIAGAGMFGGLKQLDLALVKVMAQNITGVPAPVTAPVTPPTDTGAVPPNAPAPAVTTVEHVTPTVTVASTAPPQQRVDVTGLVTPTPEAAVPPPVAQAATAPPATAPPAQTPPAPALSANPTTDELLTKALACREKGSFSNMIKADMALAFGAMADAYDAKGGALPPMVEVDAAALQAEYERGIIAAQGGNSAPAAGFKLIIDAIPSCPFDRLDAYVRKVCAVIEEQTGAKDIRCSDHDALSFGKWKGSLAALVRATPLDYGCYVIETHNEITAVVADTLCEAASIWIRGTR